MSVMTATDEYREGDGMCGFTSQETCRLLSTGISLGIPDHEDLIVLFITAVIPGCLRIFYLKEKKGIDSNMQGKSQGSNKKIGIAAVCLAAVIVVLLLVWRMASPKGTAGDKQITVEVVHGDGSSKDFDLKTQEEYLGPVLVAEGVVEDNQNAYGLYILTADGETANEDNQEWWQVTKDGEKLNTGADSTPIADGEHYELTLTVGYDG